MAAKRKTKRKAPKRRKAPVGKACRNAQKVVTRRKNDYKKALNKIKSLKKQTRLAEKTANKKRKAVIEAQNRARKICRG